MRIVPAALGWFLTLVSVAHADDVALHVALVTSGGGPRAERLTAWLAQRFGPIEHFESTAALWRPDLDDRFHVVVVDAPEVEGEARPLRVPTYDYDDVRGVPRTVPLVLLGNTTARVARAHRYLGDSAITDAEGAFHPLKHPITDAVLRRLGLQGAPCLEATTGGGSVRHAVLLDEFESDIDVEVIARASIEGRPRGAIVWRQGRFVHFGFGGDVESMTDAGRELLAECMTYSARLHEFYQGPYPCLDPAPRPIADLDLLHLDPEDVEFPREVVRLASEAASVDERETARRLIARFMPREFLLTAAPLPFSHRDVWDQWFEYDGGSLVFSRWRGDRFVVDNVSTQRSRKGPLLRGPARTEDLREIRRDSDAQAPAPLNASDRDVRRRRLVELLSAEDESESWEELSTTLWELGDDAADLLEPYLRGDPQSRAAGVADNWFRGHLEVAHDRLARQLAGSGTDGERLEAWLMSPIAEAAIDLVLLDLRRIARAGMRRDRLVAIFLLAASRVSDGETLDACLVDPDPGIRRAAASAIHHFGTSAERTSRAIVSALREENLAVRTLAAMAMSRVEEPDPELVTALEAARGVETDEIAAFWMTAAARAVAGDCLEARIQRRGPALDEASLAAALAALRDGDRDARHTAARALARDASRAIFVACEVGDAEAAATAREVVGRVAAELDDAGWQLLRELHESPKWGGMGVHAVALVRDADLYLPAIERDLFVYPRFPVGPVTFDIHGPALAAAGLAAVPVAVRGLDHWFVGMRPGLRALCGLGCDARFAAPAFAALATPHRIDTLMVPIAPTTERPLDDELESLLLLGGEHVRALVVDFEPDLKDRNGLVGWLLAAINPLLETDREALLNRLDARDPDVIGVIDALAAMTLADGERARVRAFLESSGRPELDVVGSSFREEGSVSVAQLVDSLRSTDPRVVRAAARGLSRLGTLPLDALRPLREVLWLVVENERCERIELAALPRRDQSVTESRLREKETSPVLARHRTIDALVRAHVAPRLIARTGDAGLDALVDELADIARDLPGIRSYDDDRVTGVRQAIEYLLLARREAALPRIRARVADPALDAKAATELRKFLELLEE